MYIPSPLSVRDISLIYARSMCAYVCVCSAMHVCACYILIYPIRIWDNLHGLLESILRRTKQSVVSFLVRFAPILSALWLSANLTTAYRNGFVSSAGSINLNQNANIAGGVTIYDHVVSSAKRNRITEVGVGNRAWVCADISKMTLWFYPIAGLCETKVQNSLCMCPAGSKSAPAQPQSYNN